MEWSYPMSFKKHLFTALLLAALPAAALAELLDLTVHVTGAEPSTGNLEVTVFNSEENYLQTAYLQQSGPANENGNWSTVFASVPEGKYAVVVVHDSNNNQKFDNGLFGFGGEQFAFSNQASALFGRPSFSAASFELAEPSEITIELQGPSKVAGIAILLLILVAGVIVIRKLV
jgi:uncharacterized protein (DUF2141 family)